MQVQGGHKWEHQGTFKNRAATVVHLKFVSLPADTDGQGSRQAFNGFRKKG